MELENNQVNQINNNSAFFNQEDLIKEYDYSLIKNNSLKASEEISNLSFDQRIEYLKLIQIYILENKDQIIAKIQKETGKSKTDALIGEIFAVLDHLVFLQKNLKKYLKPKKVKTPISLLGKKSRIFMDPLGVILIISPWNYPFYQAIVPIAAAFAAGNAIVYKPSEFTPLKGVLEELFINCFGQTKAMEWFQIIYGDGSVGQKLIDCEFDKIFFTGSVNTGKKIMEQASKTLTPVELELGGKDAMIVFDDANIERATSAALWGALTNTGQSCTSIERIYVQKKIYSEFKDLILRKANDIKQSVDNDGSAEIGIMTTAMQVKIVKSHYEDAIAKGAKLLNKVDCDFKSMVIPPIIFENITKDMKVLTEESFGPFLILIPFESKDEVIELANDSNYGLSGCVWTENIELGIEVAHKIKTGGMSINNVMLTEGNHYLPFGGVKNSGIGRYKGEYGLYSFCNIKSIIIDGKHNNIDPNWYPYTPKKYELMEKMTLGLYGKGFINFLKFAFYGLMVEGLSNKLGRYLKKH